MSILSKLLLISFTYFQKNTENAYIIIETCWQSSKFLQCTCPYNRIYLQFRRKSSFKSTVIRRFRYCFRDFHLLQFQQKITRIWLFVFLHLLLIPANFKFYYENMGKKSFYITSKADRPVANQQKWQSHIQ